MSEPNAFRGRRAVITGASSGIGEAIAAALAERGADVCLVARDAEALAALRERLQTRYGVRVDVAAIDLAKPEGPARLYEATSAGAPVDILINNAGLGAVGRFASIPWPRHAAMIDLNVRALHQLTQLYLDDMLARGRGHILNVASTAGFQGVPYFAGYAATKAYVVSLSEALNAELEGSNVRVSALCPGATRTRFWTAAGGALHGVRTQMMLDPESVAAAGMRLLSSGRPLSVVGAANRFLLFLERFAPRRWVVRFAGAFMKP